MAVNLARERGDARYAAFLSHQHRAVRGDAPIAHPYLSAEALARQQQAAELVVDRISRTTTGSVISYLPYIDHVRGAEGPYTIGSQYASVIVDGREAWFEVVRPAQDTQLTHIDFLAAPRLDFILGNTESPEAARFAEAIDRPQPGHVMVRLVEHEEEPLVSGYTRMTNIAHLQEASRMLVDHLIQGQPRNSRRSTIEASIPSVDQLARFTEAQLQFDPLFEASNGTRIGDERSVSVHLHQGGEPTTLYLYTTQAKDGSRTTLIATHSLTNSKLEELPTQAVGRVDSFCACEKYGRQAEGHSCAHELLGALQAATAPGRADVLTLIVWGGQDAKGKGAIAHSLKSGNLARNAETARMTGQSRRKVEVPSSLAAFPYEEMRPYDQLAGAFGAGLEAFGVTDLTVETGNSRKKGAVTTEVARLHSVGIPISLRFADSADHVPAHIHERDVTTRRRTDQHTYGAAL